MALPTLTDEQRAENLKKAAAARKARADLKARIKRGEVNFATVLASGDPIVLRMRVREILTSLPRVGAATAEKMMAECKVSEGRRVGGLGEVQKQALMAAYDEVCA